MNKNAKKILNAFYNMSLEDQKKVVKAINDIGINNIDINDISIEDTKDPSIPRT
jgi:hypothetical protein